LVYAWDAGDIAGRRLAAVSLVRIKAATQRHVAEAFSVTPIALRRWGSQYVDAGVAGLLPQRKGPRRKSKLTGDVVAVIRRLREAGASLRAVAAATGVSEGSVRNALKPAGVDIDSDDPCVLTGSNNLLPQDQEVGAEAELDCPAMFLGASVVEVPVLADPVGRVDERVAARFGLLESAPPVFTPCVRAPLVGLLLAAPALAATGLLDTAHEVYGELPNGFYSLDTMLCEGVFRALLGEARAQGATRIDPPALGRVLGLDRAPEVKT
jgi:transposase